MDSIDMIEENIDCRSCGLRFGPTASLVRNRRPVRGITSCAFIAMCFANLFLVTPDVSAQAVYSPDHPEVRALADDLVNYLKGAVKPNSQMNSRVLAALAVVQHSKRYNGSVPVSDPLVKQACDDHRSRRVHAQRSCYHLHPKLTLSYCCPAAFSDKKTSHEYR